MRSILATLTLLIVLSGALTTDAAWACPNCKLANESDSNRPAAYMYSILFMIGMPAMIFTGFGVSFYRMVKNAERAAEDQMPVAPSA